jgi:hypothetical protein
MEWVQLLNVFPMLRQWLARSLLYSLLAATTFEAEKSFRFYDYTVTYFVADQMLLNFLYQ